jgi:hypothetical protein
MFLLKGGINSLQSLKYTNKRDIKQNSFDLP